MKIFISGGSGFIGSHVAELFAKKGNEIICFDNLSRGNLLNKEINPKYNWEYLKKFNNIKLVNGDIRDFDALKGYISDCDAIIHTAAQTAVTTSMENPRIDFEVNALGTFNILESARLSEKNPTVIYCSTNKVYGDNVNGINVREESKRYQFEEKYANGIPETFSIDTCEHTPYGCSKLTGDLYVQDYGHLYGLKTGVFRMSCIYGTRQFGVEDQGWVAWFCIAALLNKAISIYGDGKQVRDILYCDDLVNAFEIFINNNDKGNSIYNIGGGKENTISLLELLEMIHIETKTLPKITFNNWRPSDQKIYVTDITKIKKNLGWEPKITPQDGVKQIIDWVKYNKSIF